MPRALESLQQTFLGMYPPSARAASFRTPIIVTRTQAEETLYPNEMCQRFLQLTKAYGQRTADRCEFFSPWLFRRLELSITAFKGNETEEMRYLNSLISKWMPENSKRVAVDSHPRLTGILDTVNSTLAHGPKTRLPVKFYDVKGRENIEKICSEEWFSGYKESLEYRKVGIGPLVGDIVARMLGTVERKGKDGLDWAENRRNWAAGGDKDEAQIKFTLSGCHDTTLGALLGSFGTFDDKWPPYTSNLAIELFCATDKSPSSMTPAPGAGDDQTPSLFGSLLGNVRWKDNSSVKFTRKPLDEMTPAEKKSLHGLYVRVRYNDHTVIIPGCKPPGKHLVGNGSFCTLVGLQLQIFLPDANNVGYAGSFQVNSR